MMSLVDNFVAFLFLVLLVAGTGMIATSFVPRHCRLGTSGTLVAGIALIGFLFHALGTIGHLTRFVFVALVIVMSLTGVVFERRVGVQQPRKRLIDVKKLKMLGKSSLASLMTQVLLGSLILVGLNEITKWNLRETSGYDALAYHLYVPVRALFDSHVLSASDLVPNAGLPLGAGALHGLFVALGGDERYSMVNWFVILTLLLGVFENTRIRNLRLAATAMTSTLLLDLGPVVFGQLSSDLLLAAFIPPLFCRFIDLHAVEERLRFVDFVLLGFLPFIKPFGILPMAALLVIYSLKIGFVRSFRVGLITICPTLVWWIKNYLQVANPFYPLLQTLFPYEIIGLEVLSSEQDVRRSFGQAVQFFENAFNWNFFARSNDNGFFLLVVLTGLALAGTIVKWSRIQTRKRHFLLGTWVVGVLLFCLVGPVFRYLLFLFVGFVLVFASTKYPNPKKKERRITRVVLGLVTSIALSIPIFHGLRGNELSLMFNGRDNTARIAEVAVQLGAELSNQDRLCVFGEGRLLSFWPLRTEYLSQDLRNPLTDPRAKTRSEIEVRLKEIGCTTLLWFEGWGLPEHTNFAVLEDMKRLETTRRLLSDDSWYLFSLT